jgi:hypothetical protein
LPALPASIEQLRCSGNNIVQIDDLSLLRIYVEINTDNLNLESLIKYRDYLLRLYGNRIPDKIQAILHNIAERIDLKNFELVSGRNREIIVPGTNETIQPGNIYLIKSFITDRKGKGNKSRKIKRKTKTKTKTKTRTKTKSKRKQIKKRSRSRKQIKRLKREVDLNYIN